jgi:hypothetical protein
MSGGRSGIEKIQLVSIHESKMNTMGVQFKNEQFLF